MRINAPLCRVRRGLLASAFAVLVSASLLALPARADGPVIGWGGTVTPNSVNGTLGTATAIATGWKHVCAIQAGTGAVICWGNSTLFQSPPDPIVILQRITEPPNRVNGTDGTGFAVAAGFNHVCAIQEETRTVVCWGDSSSLQTSPPDSLTTTGTAAALAAGRDHNCAIQAETGGVVCWGSDLNGQSTPPASVDGGSGTAVAVAGGAAHSCAIQALTNIVVCWGDDTDGQTTVPLTVDGTEGTASAIASFWNHTCAIQAETSGVVCWGSGGDNLVPPPSVDGSAGTALAVTTGWERSCAIRADNSGVVCWASGVAKPRTPPPSVDGTMGSAFAVASGQVHECAIQNGTGAVICWGPEGFDRATPPDDVNGTLDTARIVRAGLDHACALRSLNGSVVCWGSNELGKATPPPSVDGTTGTATDIALGQFHSCAIRAGSNLVACWGDDNGSGPAPGGPADPPDDLGAVSAIAAGTFHSCAIASIDNRLVCWGEGTATQVAEDFGARDVAAGSFHTCATGQVSRQAFCWPDDIVQRPEYIPKNPLIPINGGFQVDPIEARRSVLAAGNLNTCATRQTSGLLDCWGVTDFGQLDVPADLLAPAFLDDGNPSTPDYPPPPDAKRVGELAVGWRHVCAIQEADGVVRCWGEDVFQQTFPPAGLLAETITAGDDFTLAIGTVTVPEPAAALLGAAACATLAGLARRRRQSR